MPALVQPASPVVELPAARSFAVIGDPGCDGLGAATMSVFAKALLAGGADFSLVAGDLVPHGSRPLYEHVRDFVNAVSRRPVYALCGNHDTEFYAEYFGRRDYGLLLPESILVCLDNSRRRFPPETIAFCAGALASHPRPHVILAFHIPPPNPACANSMDPASWAELLGALGPHRDRLRLLLCGHVHAHFESAVDGIPLVVTGGGGARLEPVNPEVDAKRTGYHVILVRQEPGRPPRHELLSLDGLPGAGETSDPGLADRLEQAFRGECVAMFRYELAAREAARTGAPELARVFKALADSEFHHARNHHAALDRARPLLGFLEESVAGERWEVESMYREFLEYAQAKGHGLAAYAFHDARAAERVHLDLLERVRRHYAGGAALPAGSYHTCTSCGYTFTAAPGDRGRCPVCGAPRDKIAASPS